MWSALLCGAGVLYLALVQRPAQWAQVSASWRGRLGDSADNRVRVIANWLDEELRDASFATTLTPIDERLDALRRTHGLSGLFVLDARLQPTIARPPDAVFRADYVELARSVAATGVTSAEFFLTKSKLVLLICAGRPGVEPAVSMIVCLEDEAAGDVERLLGGHPGTETGEALLARAFGGGILFVSPRRFADGTMAEVIDRPDPALAMVAALAGMAQVGEYVDYRGQPVLAAVRRIPGTGWGVVVKVDLAEVHADYRRELREIWSLALGGGIVVLTLATGVAHARREAIERDRLRVLGRLGAVMDEASDAILLVRSDGRIVEANRRAALMYGLSRDELCALPIAALHADDAWSAGDRERASLAREGPALFETTHVHRDGRSFPVEVSARWLAAEHAHLYTIRDSSSRQRVEAALRETADQLSAIIDAAPASIVSVSPDGAVRSWNPASARMFGWTAAEVLGRPLPYVPPEKREESRGILARVRQGERTEGLELQRVRKDGSPIDISLWTAPLQLADGRFAGTMAVMVDISDRKRAEEEIRHLNVSLEQRIADRTADLEAANRELEAFSYSVSHDLRAPLRAIEGFSRIVVEDHGPALDAEAQRLLNVVRANVQKMDGLIDDLLELSRVGRREMRMTTVDMNRLARAAWQAIAGDGPTRVELRIGDLPEAAGDPALLRQVWVNLLSNAVKFSTARAAPVVEVGAQTDNGEIVYFVRDNGVGFEQRYADRLFQVFQRLHSDAEFPGTGVGLAIVARVVGRHGGRVWAEGRPGEGATFSFSLPRR